MSGCGQGSPITCLKIEAQRSCLDAAASNWAESIAQSSRSRDPSRCNPFSHKSELEACLKGDHSGTAIATQSDSQQSGGGEVVPVSREPARWWERKAHV